MKYEEMRSTIKSGDLLAFSHGDWKTWRGIKTEAVRIFTRSTYSHIGIAYVMGGRVMILEAVKPCLRMAPLSLEGSFYHLPLKQKWNKACEKFAMACLGIKYSEVAAMEAYFHPLEEGTVSECAAYAREVFKRMSIDLGDRSTPDAVILKAQMLGAPSIYVEN